MPLAKHGFVRSSELGISKMAVVNVYSIKNTDSIQFLNIFIDVKFFYRYSELFILKYHYVTPNLALLCHKKI